MEAPIQEPTSSETSGPLSVYYHCLLINDWERRLRLYLNTLHESGLYAASSTLHIHIVFRKRLQDVLRAREILETHKKVHTSMRMYGLPAVVRHGKYLRILFSPRNSLGENETILRLWNDAFVRRNGSGLTLFLAGQGVTNPDPLGRGIRLFEIVDRIDAANLDRGEFWFSVYKKSLDLVRNWRSITTSLDEKRYTYYQWWNNNFWVRDSLLMSTDLKTYFERSLQALHYGYFADRHSFQTFPVELRNVVSRNGKVASEIDQFSWGASSDRT